MKRFIYVFLILSVLVSCIPAFAADTVSVPTANVPAGEIASGTYIELTCAMQGARIFYTNNGETPDSWSGYYTTPIKITETTTIKAYAAIDGMQDSDIVTYEYVVSIEDAVSKPIITVVENSEENYATVSITSATQDAQIYYTIDESVPMVTTSARYTTEFVVYPDTYIRAIAVKSGIETSIVNRMYMLDAPRPKHMLVGRYLKMGTYDGDPILWRCIDNDVNGTLMLSSKILCLKAFDAIGDNFSGSHGRHRGTASGITENFRKHYGSNYWGDSTLRCWLNSNDLAWRVDYACGNPPIEGNVTENPYSSEAGFLSNFTDVELMSIETKEQRTLLSKLEYADMQQYGSESHRYIYNTGLILQNYQTAFAENFTDKFFLLDIQQLSNMYSNTPLHTDTPDFFYGTLAASAVRNCTNTYSYIQEGVRWGSWIRTPYTESELGSGVRINAWDDVNGYGVKYTSAYNGLMGVRPAFYFKDPTEYSILGSGTAEDPYYLGLTSEQMKVRAPKASLGSGEIEKNSVVFLSTETADAEIYYTVNGEDPLIDGRPYHGSGIAVTGNMVIKAIAIKDGMTDSSIASYTYSVYDTKPPLLNYTVTYKKTSAYYKFYITFEKIVNNASVFVTLNDDNGKMLSIISEPCEGDDYYILTMPIMPTVDNAKFFVWDGVSVMKPIAGREVLYLE